MVNFVLCFTMMRKELCVQLYPTLCYPRACSPLGSSVRGILQARILEWAAISFSRGSFRPRDGTQVSCIGKQTLYHWNYLGSPYPLGG